MQNLVAKSSRRPVFLYPSLKCIQTRTVHRLTTTPLQSPTPGKHRNHFKSVLLLLLADVTVLPFQACLQRHSWLLPLRAAGPTPLPRIRHYLARTQFRAFVLHTISRPGDCVPGSTTQVPTATWTVLAASGGQDVRVT